MNTYKILFLIAMIAPAFFTAGEAATAKKSQGAPEIRMYRYTNSAGTVVTSSRIPPEYAKKGYKIVSPSGVVIEEVAAEPTEEERKKLDANQLSQIEQREKDKILLLRYSQVGELIQDRDRKTGELKNKVNAEEANIVAIQNQIKSEQEKAAGIERSGKTVPDYILSKLKDLYRDQEIAEEHLETMKASLDKESKQFEEDIKRYEFLNNQRLKRQASPDQEEKTTP